MRNQRNFLKTLVISFLLVGVIIGGSSFFNVNIGKEALHLINPVGVVFTNVGHSIAGFFRNFSKIGNIYNENRDLNEKYNKALTEVARLKDAGAENDSLKKDLGFKNNSGLSLLPANVISYNPDVHDGLSVKLLSQANIKAGAAVISEGFLIGRVVETSGDIVKINLITDSDSAIPAVINGKSIGGIARGRIGRGLYLDQVPQSEPISIGDLITTSGLGGELPKSLIIGNVETVQKISGSIFQQVNIKPMINLLGLSRVYIVE